MSSSSQLLSYTETTVATAGFERTGLTRELFCGGVSIGTFSVCPHYSVLSALTAFITVWLPPSLGTPPVSIFAVVDEASYSDGGEKAGGFLWAGHRQIFAHV